MRPSPAGTRPRADLALDSVDLVEDVDHRVVSFGSSGGRGAEAAFPLAAGELGRERVEPLIPEPAELVEPVVELAERRRVDGVEPPRALGPDRREPAVAQNLEVLRHGRLRDPELRLDDGRDRPRSQLAVGEQLEDPSPDRVSQDVESVHEAQDRRLRLYKSRVILWGPTLDGRPLPDAQVVQPEIPLPLIAGFAEPTLPGTGDLRAVD